MCSVPCDVFKDNFKLIASNNDKFDVISESESDSQKQNLVKSMKEVTYGWYPRKRKNDTGFGQAISPYQQHEVLRE